MKSFKIASAITGMLILSACQSTSNQVDENIANNLKQELLKSGEPSAITDYLSKLFKTTVHSTQGFSYVEVNDRKQEKVFATVKEFCQKSLGGRFERYDQKKMSMNYSESDIRLAASYGVQNPKDYINMVQGLSSSWLIDEDDFARELNITYQKAYPESSDTIGNFRRTQTGHLFGSCTKNSEMKFAFTAVGRWDSGNDYQATYYSVSKDSYLEKFYKHTFSSAISRGERKTSELSSYNYESEGGNELIKRIEAEPRSHRGNQPHIVFTLRNESTKATSVKADSIISNIVTTDGEFTPIIEYVDDYPAILVHSGSTCAKSTRTNEIILNPKSYCRLHFVNAYFPGYRMKAGDDLRIISNGAIYKLSARTKMDDLLYRYSEKIEEVINSGKKTS